MEYEYESLNNNKNILINNYFHFIEKFNNLYIEKKQS